MGNGTYLNPIVPGDHADPTVLKDDNDYYSERIYCGIGFDGRRMHTYHYGQAHEWMDLPVAGHSVRMKLRNHEQITTWWYSADGSAWIKHPWQMEVSGFHHNVFGGLTSLKLGLYCIGSGTSRFENFIYRGSGMI